MYFFLNPFCLHGFFSTLAYKKFNNQTMNYVPNIQGESKKTDTFDIQMNNKGVSFF
jgi:hypothetical protein